MPLMPSDPLVGLERLSQQTIGGMPGGRQGPRPIPMTAFRRGDHVVACFDLPGLSREDVDTTIERNMVTIRAERRPAYQEGDEVIVDERPYGIFTRQVFLGDSLDLDVMTLDYARGELRLTIPVSEKAKPRRIEVHASDHEPQQVTANATGGGAKQDAGVQDIVLRVIRPGWSQSEPDVQRAWSAQARRELLRMRAMMHAQPLDMITNALQDSMRRAVGGWIEKPDLTRTAARLHRGAYVAVEIVDGPAPASD